MRGYTNAVRLRVKSAPNTMGARLARLAVSRGLSVIDIAGMLGASRATVYNWYAGAPIAHAYARDVQNLIEIILSSPSRELARSNACAFFSKKPKPHGP